MNANTTITARAAVLAVCPVTIPVYEGYVSTDRMTTTTLGAWLGLDHISWILEQQHPAMVARGRQRGAWDCNMLDSAAVYGELERRIRATDAAVEVAHGSGSVKI